MRRRRQTDYRDQVERRRSRWAIWWRMTIPCQDGLVYLVRLRVVQTPWFGVYVHDIHEPDDDRAPHNHPWSFVSVVLRGYYVERLYPDPGRTAEYREQRWGRLGFHRMGTGTAHVITDAGPGLKTLIFVGPRRGTWGFFDDCVFVPWEQYKGLQPVAPDPAAKAA